MDDEQRQLDTVHRALLQEFADQGPGVRRPALRRGGRRLQRRPLRTLVPVLAQRRARRELHPPEKAPEPGSWWTVEGAGGPATEDTEGTCSGVLTAARVTAAGPVAGVETHEHP